MKRTWSFKRHFTVSAGILLFLDIILKWLIPNKSGFSVGVIGGVDGPTAVFLTSKLTWGFLLDILIIVMFTIVLILYNSIRRHIERE